MGKHHSDVCPGCSRHCSLSHVRCKYGQRYIEKLQAHEDSKPRRKWEKHVTQGGLTWKLLFTASSIKKALRKKRITEEALLATLSSQERGQLLALLAKLEKTAS